MGNANQTPLGIDLFKPPEEEPSDLHVLFDIPKDGFDISTALSTQTIPWVRGQVVSGLTAEMAQTKTDLHLAIAFCPGAIRLE